MRTRDSGRVNGVRLERHRERAPAMDPKKFDELVARLASTASRRKAVKGVLAGTLASVGVTSVASAKKKGKASAEPDNKKSKDIASAEPDNKKSKDKASAEPDNKKSKDIASAEPDNKK